MSNYIFIIIIIAILYYLTKKSVLEGFEDKPTKDSYGYLNTFYTELMKEPFVYFAEPLPLGGIDQPSINGIKDECKLLFDYTNNPSIDMKKSRSMFKKLDKDPLKPFLDIIKKRKLKINTKRLDKLVKDCAVLSLKLKSIYNRGRPFQICYKYGYPIKYLKSLHSDTPSYPSSYAVQAYSIAYIIGRKYEKYQREIETIANDIAWSRVYSGNNFVSDIECAKKITLNLRVYLDSITI